MSVRSFGQRWMLRAARPSLVKAPTATASFRGYCTRTSSGSDVAVSAPSVGSSRGDSTHGIAPESQPLSTRGGQHAPDHHDGNTAGGGHDDGHNLDDASEDFDVVEASMQEMHDLAVAMSQFWRDRRNYTKEQDLAVTPLFSQWFEKLMPLLTPELVGRVVASRNARHRIEVQSFDKLEPWIEDAFNTPRSVLPNRNYVERFMFRPELTKYPELWMHAPHALNNVRADFPAKLIEVSKSHRDEHTMDLLMELSEVQNRFGRQLDAKLWRCLDALDPHRSTEESPHSELATVAGGAGGKNVISPITSTRL